MKVKATMLVVEEPAGSGVLIKFTCDRLDLPQLLLLLFQDSRLEFISIWTLFLDDFQEEADILLGRSKSLIHVANRFRLKVPLAEIDQAGATPTDAPIVDEQVVVVAGALIRIGQIEELEVDSQPTTVQIHAGNYEGAVAIPRGISGEAGADQKDTGGPGLLRD